MDPTVLVLGGTREASALCRRLSESGIRATLSLAGRVERPIRQPLPQRVGGFGGVAGLATYLENECITHVVDATHPFAAQMSTNAVAACARTGAHLIALTRPPWEPQLGDRWTAVADMAVAVAALNRPPTRVMLAIGRMHLAAFAPHPQHFYLLRLVDPPRDPLPFPNYETIIDRGPFTVENDLALMHAHGIELVVSKNAGGSSAVAKITAARTLGLPVIMIDRPAIPPRAEAHSVEAVMDWLSHEGAERGV